MRQCLILLSLLASAVLTAAEYKILLTTNAPDGLIKAGEELVFTAQAMKDGKPAPADMTLKIFEFVSGTPRKTLTQSADKIYTFKRVINDPCHAYIKCWLLEKGKKSKPVLLKNSVHRKTKNVVGVGAYVAAEKQRIARTEPKDFDAVWDKYKSELKQLPVKVLEKKTLKNSNAAKLKINVYDVKVAAPGGKNVSGILCVPQNAKRKYPAIVYYHGAGVRSSAPRLNPEAITFNVNAHGLPNMMPKKFYDDILKNANPYKTPAVTREVMFRYMFLRALRALEYVRTLPEWNGRDLIVTGGSQGGVQTIVAAAQDKFVTLAVPHIPAMIGVAEFLCKKNVQVAWPAPYIPEWRAKKDITAIAAKFDYLDGAFHLRRIKCPVYVCVGMIDTHAAHVAAAMNDCPAQVVWTRNIYEGHRSVNPAGSKAINEILKKCTQEAAAAAAK